LRVQANLLDRLWLKQLFSFIAGRLEPAIYVRAHLIARKRGKSATKGYPLFELPQLRLIKPLFQFGLPHQDDLNEPVTIGFQIREEPDLFKQLIA
jgi:hypothetical protein